MSRVFASLLFVIASIGLFAACGDVSSSSSFDCCLNGAYYECNDADEFETCNLEDGASACDRDPFKDSECE
ncbi:MAG: hypothetical protein ACQEVA_06515 [Myxococcota bacterium]